MTKYTIARISRDACTPFILDIHYAHRWPAMSHAFGLFLGEELRGVVAFGRPAMKTVRTGLAGPDNEREVWELMRLAFRDNQANEATQLVSGGIDLLIKELKLEGAIILSFADPEQGHHGGVYQASSFGYYGMSAKRKHWQFVSGPHMGKHCATVVGEFKGQQNRRALLEEKYGDTVQYIPRPRKHRYVRIAGSKSYKRKKLREVRYKTEPYPKGT